MIYEEIPQLNRQQIENAVRRNEPDELLIAVLSAALYPEDHGFSEALCVRLSTHPHFNVRGNAVLGFAHLARIDGKLNEELVKPLIIAALADEHEYVRGQAKDAKDDTEWYLKWKYPRWKK